MKVIEGTPEYDQELIAYGNKAVGQPDYLANSRTVEGMHIEDPIRAKQVVINLIEAKRPEDHWPDEDKNALLDDKILATRNQISFDELCARQLERIRKNRPSGPAITASGRDMSGEVIEAALCQALRIEGTDEAYSDQINQTAHTTFKGQIGLQQTLIMAAAMNGYRPQPGERLNDGNLRHVLAYAFPPLIQATNFPTVGLSGILSNIANKELKVGYEEEDSSWREIAAVKSVPDFKQITCYRMLDNMEYEELGPAGEIKQGSINEESYTRQAKTYAKMFSLTRTTIINDDMSAFDDLRTRIGRGAAQKFNKIFWARFMNNSAHFTTGLTNYIEGSTTNLGADGVGLGLGVLAFRKMRSGTADNSKRISGRPKLLLVPPELEGIARRLYVASNLAGGGSTTTADANEFQNMFAPVVSDFLSDSSYTGYSTTAWFLLNDPKYLATIVASFLNGNTSPTVESADADFDQLGISLRGYFDFGVDLADPLGGLKVKGAA